jgi:hypothetical protein
MLAAGDGLGQRQTLGEPDEGGVVAVIGVGITHRSPQSHPKRVEHDENAREYWLFRT